MKKIRKMGKPTLASARKPEGVRRRGQRGPQKSPTKAQVTLRIDRSTLDYFKSKGKGWQTRINDVLASIVTVVR